jgi:hypothetical protein
MKTIRYFAGALMLITGILHLLPFISEPGNPDAFAMLIFGIAYLTIGVLLYLNKYFGQIIGVLIPALGLGIGFVKIGIRNWDTMLSIMFLIDAVVIVCCIILLINRKKTKVVST